MRFIEGFLSPGQAHDLLAQLGDSDWVEWQRETFRIFGRRVDAPRSLSWFGDAGLNYRYRHRPPRCWLAGAATALKNSGGTGSGAGVQFSLAQSIR